MTKYTIANFSRVMRDLINCTRLMGNPLRAYNYLRSRSDLQMGEFTYQSLRFQGRKEDWAAIREVLVEDEYACIDTILECNAHPRILDLGANIGSFALKVFSHCPHAKVVSVEAAEDTFRVLETNRQCNPSADWRVLNNGVWKEDGPLTLMRRGLSVSHRVVEGDAGEVIPGISLPTLLGQLGWDSVDLIKMDIEGGEEAVIPVATEILSRTRALIIEIHTDRIDTAPVLAALRSVFSHKWQLNDRESSKPLYVMSNEHLNLGSGAWRVEV